MDEIRHHSHKSNSAKHTSWMVNSGLDKRVKNCSYLVIAPLFIVYKINLSIRRSLLIKFDGLFNKNFKNSSHQLFHSPLESRSLLVQYNTQDGCDESITRRRCSSLCGGDPLRNTVSRSYKCYSNDIYGS